MKKAIISISHSSYINNVGGLEKVILEQYEVAHAKGYEYVAVFPIGNNITFKGHVIKHRFHSYGVHINKSDYLSMSLDELVCLLKKYKVEKVFVHSLISYKFSQITTLLESLSEASLFFYVHDYKSVCDGHNLLKNKKKYCGSEGLKFSKCITCRFYVPGIISSRQYHALFEHFRTMKFIFPSEAAKNVWCGVYKNISKERLIVLPHQIVSVENQDYSRNPRLRLAYIGYKSFNKGWNTFRNLVRHINEKAIDIDLYVLGKTEEHLPNVKEIEVSFLKDGADAMVNAIRRNKIDIAFLWSPWPETYSYTFYESYVGGAYVITNKDSGNIAVGTKRYNCGCVFDDEQELLKFFDFPQNINTIKSEYYVRPLKLTFNSEFINLK